MVKWGKEKGSCRVDKDKEVLKCKRFKKYLNVTIIL